MHVPAHRVSPHTPPQPLPRIKFDTPAHRIRYLFTGSLLGATLGVIQLLSREVLPLLYKFVGSLYGAGKDSPS